ncbi:hypothetical protein LSH36_1134g02084 [Paralvinella palmiformis]|uniref:Serine-threonine kinase receptor-associated protein n=1 Tax=Paralvinella palmiformis TaxID=53620 RepID=A0AAD9IVX8_9ANNE|nr:hypothetical protein LSH36_1134g02084 [Paralvinella palmiformis]
MANLRQTPLTCSGHTRPVVDLAFSDITECGYFLISACKAGQSAVVKYLEPTKGRKDYYRWPRSEDVAETSAYYVYQWNFEVTPMASLCYVRVTPEIGLGRLKVIKEPFGAPLWTKRIWDAVSGSELHALIHKHIVKCVAFSNDTNKLLTGSNEKLLRIYDLNNIDSEPDTLPGHTGGIPSCVWLHNGTNVISVSDDKTMRMWDVVNKQEVKQLTLPAVPNSVELSHDGEVITVPYGNTVGFYKAESFELIKEIEVPSQVNSASLHPEKNVFVCGGEDFKMYKFDYNTGVEIESFKGHFGPVHCVRFSPDGELYASGSEDGTLRLWQTTVGKTYGLWKCVMPEELNSVDSNAQQIIKPEA